MAYNSFPYTNYHELNLDYLLNKSKKIEGNVQETADNVLRATQQADRSTQQAVNSQNSATASAQSAAASSQSAVNSANSAAASAQSAEEARAAAGDPKTFTAATQLTDTTKIYVYVGETGTYTYGHYYYYQGGTWHDGGVYGTWATDDALSDTSTNAVQNKVVTGAVNSLKSDIDDFAHEIRSRNLFNGNVQSGYINKFGAYNASGTYHYTDKINVVDYRGRTLYFSNNAAAGSVRFLCAYNGNVVVSDAGSDNVINSYLVPDNITDIVVSFTYPAAGFAVEPDYINGVYMPFFDFWDVKQYQPVKDAVNIPKPVAMTADSLAPDQSLRVNSYNSIKRGGQVFSFYCKVPNGMGTGYVVVGKSTSNGYAFGISATQWVYFVNGRPSGNPVNHNLTITDYLYVRVEIKTDGIAYITVKTNGGIYTRTNTSWSGDHGHPYAWNNTSVTLTDAKFTYSVQAARNRTWVFGDSYVSIAATRWPYYMFDWGYDNLMVSGYPGEESRIGFYDWRYAVTLGTPSIAIWAYGMNNTDEGAINADWLNYTRVFLEDCKQRDIIPILATIPCVPGGDNSYKNAWVRASGYRYIEFANAVNTAQDATTWFSDMLSSDNVHPTTEGAIALAIAALEAVPEIAVA